MTKGTIKLSRIALACGRAFTSRSFMVASFSVMVAAITLYMSQSVHAVYIRDGNNTLLSFTAKRDVSEILEDNGIATMAADIVDFTGFAGKTGEIRIKRAYPVEITADGRNFTVQFAGDTVDELLESEKISLGEYDIINYPRGSCLSAGNHVVIKRVSYETHSVEEVIPHETVYKQNCLLKTGRTRVLSAGADGKRVLTYTKRLVDGKEEEKRLVDSRVLAEPVTALVLVGSQAPVSPLDFGVTTDADGVPLQYVKKLEAQISTGYSAPAYRAKGASGLRLSAGSVAVRAADIPYGTKLYIASPDGSFVYGYAVAADTGVGLLQGIIDIDLFYDTYIESCLNGRKYLDVYVLG